jgi:hypothetical protein
MRYGIVLTAKDLQVHVIVATSRWPRKLAKQQAQEALAYLGGAVRVAIEGAPHVGTPRGLIDVSSVVGLDAAADRELGAPRPQGEQVGSVSWEAMESFIKAVELPPGTKLIVDVADGRGALKVRSALKVRRGATGQVALAWVAEDRIPAPEGDVPLEVATFEISFQLDPEQIKERVLLAADTVLFHVKQRDGTLSPGVPDTPDPGEGPPEELPPPAMDDGEAT